MRALLRCIISDAQPSQSYPDTLYIDAVDLDKGKELQMSSKNVKLRDLSPHFGQPVQIDCDLTIQQRRTGGGFSVILNSAQISPAGWANEE